MATIKVWRTHTLLPAMSKSTLCFRTFTNNQHSGSCLVTRPALSRLKILSISTNSNVVNSRCVSHIPCIHHHNSQKKRLLLDECHHHHFIQCGKSRRGMATEPTAGGYEQVVASQPVHLAQSIFEQCHALTGLPWWGTVIATTLGLRLALTLPLAIYSKHISAKVEKIQPEVLLLAQKEFVRKYRHRAVAEKWSQERMKKTIMFMSKSHAKDLYIRDNCHPAKSFVILMVQLPLWICLSLALRNMSGFQWGNKIFVDPNFQISDFAAGGMLWFSDLTVADPYYIFPVIFGTLNLLNIEMQSLQKGPMDPRQKYVLRFMRGIAVVMIPIASYVPVAMSMYWATSASYSTCQNILLKLPSTKALLRMPTTKMDSDTPFRDMQEEFSKKYLQRKEVGGKEENSDESMTTNEGNVDDSSPHKRSN